MDEKRRRWIAIEALRRATVGLAAEIDEDGDSVTETHMRVWELLGTPGFMTPSEWDWCGGECARRTEVEQLAVAIEVAGRVAAGMPVKR